MYASFPTKDPNLESNITFVQEIMAIQPVGPFTTTIEENKYKNTDIGCTTTIISHIIRCLNIQQGLPENVHHAPFNLE